MCIQSSHVLGSRNVSKRNYIVKAIWDEDAGVFYSESDIVGLHIEAKSLDEFEKIMHENAFDLVVANHIKPQELAKSKIADLIPTIFWERGANGMAAA